MESIIGSKYVRINSRYRVRGDCSNFTCQFVNSEMQQISAIALMSFTMNRLYTNIQSFNNTLVFNTNVGLKVYTIAPAQYNAESLELALNTAFNGELTASLYTSDPGNTTTFKIDVAATPNIDNKIE